MSRSSKVGRMARSVAGKKRELEKLLKELPDATGVYLMKDSGDQVLYVGKAKSIRSRVRSYFARSADLSKRISRMVTRVARVDFIVTSSEAEALALEDNLIKEKRPFYNILLKDDKSYPYLRLTDELFPRLVLARVSPEARALAPERYFGPYISASSLRSALRFIRKTFKLRQSADRLDGVSFRRACLNYQIGSCSAPCAGKISASEYGKSVQAALFFLKGKRKEAIRQLESSMLAASEKLDFERAARTRDQIGALKTLDERQSVAGSPRSNEDIIAARVAPADPGPAGKSTRIKAGIALYRARGGRVIDSEIFLYDRLEERDLGELMAAFIRDFYAGSMEIPPRIGLNVEPDDIDLTRAWLESKRSGTVKIIVPSRSRLKRLVEMAERNLEMKLKIEARLDRIERASEALEKLKERLRLDREPNLIEAYDISNISGSASVGAVVTFRAGREEKKGYRRYHMKGIDKTDDYASIAQLARRRLTSAMKGELADLIIVDGGPAHLAAVDREARALGLADKTTIISIAKGADRNNYATDLVYRRGSDLPVDFDPESIEMRLLRSARDEAHRFAITFHRATRDKTLTKSSLDRIDGVGPKRKRALLKEFGSIRAIAASSPEDIARRAQIGAALAKRVFESLRAGR